MLDEHEEWHSAISSVFRRDAAAERAARGSSRRWLRWRPGGRRAPGGVRAAAANGARVARSRPDWMPAAWYAPDRPDMRAFALPSFYDGRVRINLAGRERYGMVRAGNYDNVCDEVEELVRACRDVRTGEPVVETVERAAGADPRTLDETEADLIVVWRGGANGFVHPRLGRIGPYPLRRTGGHTGGYGMAFFCGDAIEPGDYGMRSAFDVVPSVVELLGEPRPNRMSGESLLSLVRE